jgi:hypothetical protein
MACNDNMHHASIFLFYTLFFSVLIYGMNIEIVEGRDGMEGIMQKLIKAFENMMVAITFAEAGEYDEAHRLSTQDQKQEPAEITAIGIKATKA